MSRAMHTPEISVVIPLRNAMRFLPQIVPPLVANARSAGPSVEVIFVDNGSTDGSYEFLQTLGDGCGVLQERDVSISALRNLGARAARGTLLSFVDSDCLVCDGYFDKAVEELAASGACATGYEYALPRDPGWIERAWHDLHYHSEARDVEYLNAGNFVIRRDVFERVGGFREDLYTGEDAELGQRIIAAGERIHANPDVCAVHLGNPKSVKQFYRRQVWHGIGMFGTVNRRSIDRPTAMLSLHLLGTVVGVLALASHRGGLVTRIAVAAALQLMVPTITVAYRLATQRRWSPILSGVFLYWVYYWARVQSLWIIITGRSSVYRK